MESHKLECECERCSPKLKELTLYRVSLVTKDSMLVSVANLDETTQIAQKYVDYLNSHHHHGEVTTFSVEKVG